MRWLAILALAACNQVFGIDHTRHGDASIPFFDARTDAPFACPMLGGAPAFQPGLFQAFQQTCLTYSISSKGTDDHGMALCSSASGYGVAYGPVDKPLQQQTWTPGIAGNLYLGYVRLDPDDDQAIIGYLDTNAVPVVTRVQLYSRVSDGNWSELGEIATIQSNGFAQTAIASTPTRGTPRHVIVLDYTLKQLDELVEGDGNTYPWTTTALQTLDLATVSPQSVLSLSSDGLRLVYFAFAGANEGIYYADRAALMQPFGTPVWLMDLPQTSRTDPFLTDNCSRLYISGLDSIFYAVQ